jgi:hypothetical protein
MAPTLPIPHPLNANRYPLSPTPIPSLVMSHLYRFSINPASSLPTSLQSYAHLSWIRYTVFPDGSIFAEMPDGCLMVEANSPYRAAG